MTPDEAIFWEHVKSIDFQEGVDRAKWGLLQPKEETQWPTVYIWIKTALYGIHKSIELRFTLDGYPSSAPTVCPWNAEQNCKLQAELWPIGSASITNVFKYGWRGGQALYCPLDRSTLGDHGNWKQQYPDLYWQSSFTICTYLDFIHRILN
jgi:hypothetical protein